MVDISIVDGGYKLTYTVNGGVPHCKALLNKLSQLNMGFDVHNFWI